MQIESGTINILKMHIYVCVRVSVHVFICT